MVVPSSVSSLSSAFSSSEYQPQLLSGPQGREARERHPLDDSRAGQMARYSGVGGTRLQGEHARRQIGHGRAGDARAIASSREGRR